MTTTAVRERMLELRHALLDLERRLHLGRATVARNLAEQRARVLAAARQGRVVPPLYRYADLPTIPTERVADYTQAMMDLGAMICTRSRPHCGRCPLAEDCEAHAQGRETAFPAPRPRRDLPVRQTRMLMLQTSEGEVLLERRPPTGIWGGLWSFPECPLDEDVVIWCREVLNLDSSNIQSWEVLRHTFSHFHLDITPVRIRVNDLPGRVMEADRFVWYNTHQPDERGLAAPVQRLISILATDW